MVKLSFSRAIILSALGLFLLFAGTSKVMAIGIKIQNSNYDIDSQQLVVKGKLEGFEASTSVTLKSLNTGAQLASQITEKQFSFKIPISSFSDVPCEILVLAGSESATDAVGKGPGGCTRYEYTLTGIVTDEPIPYATVSVTLDGVTYTTTADEFGNYELPILSANLNQLVKIDASATDAETGDSIDFVNLAGSFSRVLDGNANGNVTNVSTASYILAVEANGGSEPTTIEELQDAETSIDATELFELAALIKLIVDDRNYSLPEGETSLIDFISDPSAVETYKETIPQEDLDAALSEILSDSDLVAGFTPDEIPERYYAIPVATPGYIARAGDALEFDPTTNRGSLLSIDGNRGIGINQPFIWEIDTSGRLDITLDAPVVIENFPYIETLDNITEEERSILEANGIGQISELTSIEGYLYTRVTDGTLVDIASLEVRQVRTYPPIPLDGQNILVLANDEVVDINVDDVSFTKLGQWRAQYGDIVAVKPVNRKAPAFVLNCPELVRHVLVGNHRNYTKGVGFERVESAIGSDFFGDERPLTCHVLHSCSAIRGVLTTAGSASPTSRQFSRRLKKRSRLWQLSQSGCFVPAALMRVSMP